MNDTPGCGPERRRRTSPAAMLLDADVATGLRIAGKTALDLGVVALAIVAAYVIRFERIPDGPLGRQLAVMVLLLPLGRLVAARAFGAHRSSWRLFGLAECLVLTRAVLTVSAVLVAARLLVPWLQLDLHVVPWTIIALEGSFSLAGLVGMRVVVRMLDEQLARRAVLDGEAPTAHRQRALLVGAGRAGRMAAHELRARPDAGYDPVGFLDDDRTRTGQVIDGVPVLGSTAQAAAVAAKVGAEVLILTMPSVGRATTREVVERCRAAELPIQTVPGLYELLAGKVGITTIRPLRIEDLLGREVVAFDDVAQARVRHAFAGRRIVVTGAGGSIGAELCRQLAALSPAKLVLVENHETHLFDIEQELVPQLGRRVVPSLTDVRDRAEIDAVFAEHRPEVVFHAAAYKHVPMMERHPTKAVLNNVRGTRVVAEAARDFGVERFLLVSTDKAVNPTSVMGATKRAAELTVLSLAGGPDGGDTRYSAVRFGNVLGSAGSVLHTFSRQIEAGGPITLTHPEITRFFMTIPEAVRLVLQATAVGEGGDLFVLDMGEPVKILDLARQMIRLAGMEEDEIGIEIVGLRPGEKLHEELYGEAERGVPSVVPSVWVSRGPGVASVDGVANVSEWIRALEVAAETSDVDHVAELLGVGTGYPAPARREQTDPGTHVDEVSGRHGALPRSG